MKRQKLEALLIEHGCVVVRNKGKHTVWENQEGAQATVPRHNEIKKFTARGDMQRFGHRPKESHELVGSIGRSDYFHEHEPELCPRSSAL